jgi:hypothetical protein
MKRIQIVFLMVSFMLSTLFMRVWAVAQESDPLGGASAIVPGQAGTTGAVPSADTRTGPEPAGTTSGIVPNLQAPSPTFGAEPTGATGLSAPGNGAILPQINSNGIGYGVMPMNTGSELTPRPMVPPANQ